MLFGFGKANSQDVVKYTYLIDTTLSLDGKGALPGGSFCFISGEPNLR